MDRTLINIISIIIGGAGLLTVITGFNVPELNMSYFGQNPFAVKRDVIENVMKWIFTFVALAGLTIQIGAEIWGQDLPSRLHETKFYLKLSILSLIGTVMLVWLLTISGNYIARLIWQPKIIQMQKEAFIKSAYVIEHDGWREDQLKIKELILDSQAESYRHENMRQAEERILQIEKLLNLASDKDLKSRIEHLKKYFKNVKS